MHMAYFDTQDMTPAGKSYLTRTLAFMGGYAALNVAAILGVFEALPAAAGWLLALAVAAPVAGQIWATLTFMRDSDEFVSALLARQFIMASGIAMALFSAWGFAESYASAPHVPGWAIYPLFWAAFGVVSGFVKTTRS